MVFLMSRHPVVPPELKHGPFTVAEALQTGLTRKQLRGRSWRRISTGLYAWAGVAEAPAVVLAAIGRRLPAGAAFSDRTAAWLHRLDLPPCDPVEVTVPHTCRVSARAGVFLRRCTLSEADVIVLKGLPVTSPLRTVFALSRRLPLIEAVVAVDLALHQRLVALGDLRRYVAANAPCRGSLRLDGLPSWPTLRPSRPWSHGYACSWSWRGSQVPRYRSRFTTPGAASSAGPTCTTEPIGSALSSMAAPIAIAWLRTIPGRTAC